MKRPKRDPAEVARALDEWLGAVNALQQQVREWAERRGWAVEQSEREVREEELGTYTVPILEISTPRGEVHLEPIGYDIWGAKGRVDLRAWPTHYRVMLLRKEEPNWVVMTDSGIRWPHPWSEATFAELTEGLIIAE